MAAVLVYIINQWNKRRNIIMSEKELNINNLNGVSGGAESNEPKANERRCELGISDYFDGHKGTYCKSYKHYTRPGVCSCPVASCMSCDHYKKV